MENEEGMVEVNLFSPIRRTLREESPLTKKWDDTDGQHRNSKRRQK
jgi:hypothetical protein